MHMFPSTTLDKQELDDIEGLGSSDEEEMDVGVVEPRPLGITSYREKVCCVVCVVSGMEARIL